MEIPMNITNTINGGGPMFGATNSVNGGYLLARPTLTISTF